MKRHNSSGFTLMEMLIVVAIIAILVAIAIPTLTNALEKSKEAADEANIRAAYAQIIADGTLGNKEAPTTSQTYIKYDYSDATATYKATITATQETSGWTSTVVVGGMSVPAKDKTGSWVITYTTGTGKIEIQ